jgi:hypothetical protein
MWWAALLNSIVALYDSGGAGGGAGSYESIATVVGTGSATSLTFSSIPSTYKSLQIRAISSAAGISGTSSLEFNGDSGTNYATHRIYADGTTVGASGSVTRPNTTYSLMNGGTTVAAYGVGIVDILDYASTTKNKTVRSFTGLDTNGNGVDTAFMMLNSAVWLSTSAITSIKIINNGSLAYNSSTVFSLYGIKGA